jgi:serine/threonine protein kinase
MADRSGQQLGNYRLLRRLGSGSFAEVYLAEHIYLKRQIAVKVLHLELAQQEFPGFLQEAQTIARLKHPNIISVFDFGIDGVPFLVMDYLPHGSLREHHPPGTIVPLPTIVSYLKQVAEALQYAHEAKVIHRDVKPANMLISDEGRVILSDFGIATTAHRTASLQTMTLSGSPHYIAPEQIAGKPRPASDQYSLGMVIYEWLCGKPAFLGEPLAVMYQQTYAPVPRLCELIPTIIPEVEQVVLKALAKDPQQRFESVQAFAQAFTAAFEEPLAPTVIVPPQLVIPTTPAMVQKMPAQHISTVPLMTKKQWGDRDDGYTDAKGTSEAQKHAIEWLQSMPEDVAFNALANAYREVQEGRIRVPHAIRELAEKFDIIARDPQKQKRFKYDAARAALALYRRARECQEEELQKEDIVSFFKGRREVGKEGGKEN